MSRKTPPTAVDFVHTDRDREILRLAGLGRPAAFIALATGTSLGQVWYRLRKGGDFKLRDIRSGRDRYNILGRVAQTKEFRTLSETWIDQVLEDHHVVAGGEMVVHRPRKSDADRLEGKARQRKTHRPMPVGAK